MALIVKNFVDNETVIDAAFLNQLQQAIKDLEAREGQRNPQMIAFVDDSEDIPARGKTANLSLQGLAMYVTPIVGDVIIGTGSQNMARITSLDGQFIDVVGI